MSDTTTTNRRTSKRTAPSGVVEHRVRNGDGGFTTIRKVDAASPTFGEDMLHVFRKNVAAARRENKRTVGVADVDPAER